MASYQVEYAKGVEKDFRKIPAKIAKRIVTVIDKLGNNPPPSGSVKLVGFELEYRIRVRDCRVTY